MDIGGIDSCGHLRCLWCQESMNVKFDVTLIVTFFKHSVVKYVRYL